MEYYNPTQVAKLLQKRRTYVIEMIECGRLQAVNCSSPNGKRRCYRITTENLEQFNRENAVYQRNREQRKRRADLPFIEEFV